MPNFKIVITVVTLAVIGSSLCIRIKRGRYDCLQKSNDRLILRDHCDRKNLNQQFYLNGGLRRWESNTIRSLNLLSGSISTACPYKEVYAFLNNNAQFSDQYDNVNLYFRLIESNPAKVEQKTWQIKSSSTGFCLTHQTATYQYMNVIFADCRSDNYSQLWYLANFLPDTDSACQVNG